MTRPFCPAYLKAQGVQILDPVPAAATKPAELAPNERRDPVDPHCPKWCQYACTGAWRTGRCLIRIPEATKAITTGPVSLWCQGYRDKIFTCCPNLQYCTCRDVPEGV